MDPKKDLREWAKVETKQKITKSNENHGLLSLSSPFNYNALEESRYASKILPLKPSIQARP